ncbi:MAG: 1,4-dihydroxy-6-naphthoate synthase [Bacteroidia bacterium]|jgi:1,4-dihydroxy-6-naphthoate synthase|nr:1,4-dihydroxy-6-naphthoate synthase [Bacteroidia bacterium]
MKTKLTLGYSPCPNDCFIFDALVHGKIDTGELEFDVQLEDVETLNQKALKGELDVTKLSFHAYAKVMKQYILLRSGSALGFNCGPLLIKSKVKSEKLKEDWLVAIPGELTTANFLLSIAYPEIKNKKVMLFSEIEDAVLRGEVDAGLIIHESRFTYQDKGLEKVADLGEFWEDVIHAPIPLGGIVIKRNLAPELQQQVNALIRKSVEYAFEHPESSMPYVRAHAQEMSEEVMKKHIALYVNAFSVDLGEQGQQAVELMFEKAKALGLISAVQEQLILE